MSKYRFLTEPWAHWSGLREDMEPGYVDHDGQRLGVATNGVVLLAVPIGGHELEPWRFNTEKVLKYLNLRQTRPVEVPLAELRGWVGRKTGAPRHATFFGVYVDLNQMWEAIHHFKSPATVLVDTAGEHLPDRDSLILIEAPGQWRAIICGLREIRQADAPDWSRPAEAVPELRRAG